MRAIILMMFTIILMISCKCYVTKPREFTFAETVYRCEDLCKADGQDFYYVDSDTWICVCKKRQSPPKIDREKDTIIVEL